MCSYDFLGTVAPRFPFFMKIKVDNETNFDKEHLYLLETGCISLEKYMFCRETFTNLEIFAEKQRRSRDQPNIQPENLKGFLQQILDFLAGRR